MVPLSPLESEELAPQAEDGLQHDEMELQLGIQVEN